MGHRLPALKLCRKLSSRSKCAPSKCERAPPSQTSMSRPRQYCKQVSNWSSIERETESWGITPGPRMKRVSKASEARMCLKAVEMIQILRRRLIINSRSIILVKPVNYKRIDKRASVQQRDKKVGGKLTKIQLITAWWPIRTLRLKKMQSIPLATSAAWKSLTNKRSTDV